MSKTRAARLQDEYALAAQAYDRACTGLRWLVEDRDAGDDFATEERVERARQKVRDTHAALTEALDRFTALSDADRASVSLRDPII
jgi:hypothetical protein